MQGITKAVIRETIKDEHWETCVDLGCGEGEIGETLKQHCTFLIGVDHNKERLDLASQKGIYDQLIYADIRDFPVPNNTQAVFIFDLVEHLPKKESYELLHKLKGVPYVMLTTPSAFWPLALNGHVSLWTEEELRNYGFRTTTYNLGLASLFYGLEIIAVRER